MIKRIIYGVRRSYGRTINFAMIQVLIMESTWFNVKIIEDPDKDYVTNRAEECLSYMHNELHKDKPNQ